MNYTAIKETTKTVLLTAAIAGIAGFVAGVHYSNDNAKALMSAHATAAAVTTSK